MIYFLVFRNRVHSTFHEFYVITEAFVYRKNNVVTLCLSW